MNIKKRSFILRYSFFVVVTVLCFFYSGSQWSLTYLFFSPLLLFNNMEFKWNGLEWIEFGPESNIYHRPKPDEPTTYQRHLVWDRPKLVWQLTNRPNISLTALSIKVSLQSNKGPVFLFKSGRNWLRRTTRTS